MVSVAWNRRTCKIITDFLLQIQPLLHALLGCGDDSLFHADRRHSATPGIPMRFCNECGGALERRVPAGDHAPRLVCTQCGTIHYRNPKVIVGCVPQSADGRVLMCKRAIEPRLGLWTFPAGFLELAETSAQGEAREAMEEAGASVDIEDLLEVVDVH